MRVDQQSDAKSRVARTRVRHKGEAPPLASPRSYGEDDHKRSCTSDLWVMRKL